MADFSQSPNQQQDPDAIKKALLAKLFGGTPGAGLPTSPGAPGTAQPTPDATAAAPPTTAQPTTAQPTTPTSAPAQPITPAAGPTPAKPMTATPAAVEPGAPSPILSEADYGKQNPAAPHTPYVEPDLKHRLLEGIFAGAQAFGRDPGAGERMLNSYLGNIQNKEDAEKNFPQTSAADAHKRYMDYAAGAKAPIDLEDLKSQITERQMHAKELAAQADARANPAPKTKPVQIADPADPKNPVPALQDQASGKIIDQEGKEIPGAKLWEKPAAAEKAPSNAFELWQKQNPNGTAQDWLKAEAATKPPKESRSDKSADVVERETRTNIRKAQQSYRGAESTANMQREFISEAKGGNKAAVKIVPLEGALEITTSQGVHRINRTEVEQYGGAGSLWDRIVGKIGKGLTGKDIPDDVLNDMDKMTQEVEKNAWERYNSEYDDEVGIAKNNGVANIEQHLPRIKQRAGGAAAAAPAAGGAGALPPGWK